MYIQQITSKILLIANACSVTLEVVNSMPRHQFQKSISDCKVRNVTANFDIMQS